MSLVEMSNFTACVGLYLIHGYNMCVTLGCNYNAKEGSLKP